MEQTDRNLFLPGKYRVVDFPFSRAVDADSAKPPQEYGARPIRIDC